ncbi:MAG: hypothetical protein ACK4Y5_06500 [Acetobacteraceae bacterium]|jgi:hypothetical protein
MQHFLSDDENTALQLAIAAGELPAEPAPAFYRVSYGQLSIARHYGGIKFGGHTYTHFPAGDQLIRDDVLQWVTKRRKAERKAESDQAKAAQGDLL